MLTIFEAYIFGLQGGWVLIYTEIDFSLQTKCRLLPGNGFQSGAFLRLISLCFHGNRENNGFLNACIPATFAIDTFSVVPLAVLHHGKHCQLVAWHGNYSIFNIYIIKQSEQILNRLLIMSIRCINRGNTGDYSHVRFFSNELLKLQKR